MSSSRTKIRLQKLLLSLKSPTCWRALKNRVFPAIEHLSILKSLDIDGVIDVGANRGQFSLACRLALPKVPIVAFEPIPSEAKAYRAVHGGCRGLELIESALGDSNGEADLHLSQSADNSSLLAIGDLQSKLVPSSQEVGLIKVPVSRLDDFQDHWLGRSRQLLKIDVQGFELSVLKGAENTLKNCSFVYAECSEVVLYQGQALRHEVTAYLNAHGFQESSSVDPTYDGDQLVQANYLFVR